HECINEIVTNLIEENKMVTVDDVTRELEKVVDPEIGLPITEMHLVDEITIKEDGELFIKYHLTAPFCPPIFAEDIGMNIRQLTSKLDLDDRRPSRQRHQVCRRELRQCLHQRRASCLREYRVSFQHQRRAQLLSAEG